MGRKRKQIKCDRDCLHCPYPEYPPSCSELPMTKWEHDAIKIARCDLHEPHTIEQERAYRRVRDRKKRLQRKYAEEQACIRQSRVARGILQWRLAEMIGISKSALSNWERGIDRANWEMLFPFLPELIAQRKAASGSNSLQSTANQNNYVHYN